ncbi:hypothetical protein IE53DRAFT_367158 [Violaceomyces palustris]|uniref:Uncharacterized protein n=1 Tax=Violaceomyces palustris TaxID=1673888 RepID=A0ACD0P309_9BASI|nr:hypothetical protein IE53DRAFT_367158 [Violaceomyces palustris]
MTVAARRSTRLSAISSSSSDPITSPLHPTSNQSTRQARRSNARISSLTATTSSSSTTSPDVLPTIAAKTAASKARKKGVTGNERRLEDILADQDDEGGDGDMSMGFALASSRPPPPPSFTTASKGKARSNPAMTTTATSTSSSASALIPSTSKTSRSRRSDAASQPDPPAPDVEVDEKRKASTKTASSGKSTTRRPRKTFNEEAEGDFIFTRESKASGTNGHSTIASSAASTSSHSSSAPSGSMGPPTLGGPPARKKRAVEPAAKSSESRSAQQPRVASRTIIERLPIDELGGETPIIRRNQAYRLGLGAVPSAVASSSAARGTGAGDGASGRRSSLGLKGMRRMSSLRDGTAAYPHSDVPEHELYRHCSVDLPPVVRMKHLAGWCLNRSTDQAYGLAEVPPPTAASTSKTKVKSKSKKGQEAFSLPPLTLEEREAVAGVRPLMEEIVEKTLRDLNDGVFGISWMGRETKVDSGPSLQPHPRNVSNRANVDRLASLVDAMSRESLAWTTARERLREFEKETAALEALLSEERISLRKDPTSLVMDADEEQEVGWTKEDLDEEGLAQMEGARKALAWLDSLRSGSQQAGTNPSTNGNKAKAAGSNKGKGKVKAGREEEDSDVAGSEYDPRWKDVEFNIDLLRSRSHQFSQLEKISSRYVRTVSAQAAQSLRDRTKTTYAKAPVSKKNLSTTVASSSKGRGSTAAKASSSNSNEEGAADQQDANQQARMENLLSGIRESSGLVEVGVDGKEEGREEGVVREGEEDDLPVRRGSPDESDAIDVLRAFASVAGTGNSAENRA